MASFDLIFVSNIPSFYKVRLYNEISKHRKVLSVYFARNEATRNNDFVSEKPSFESTYLQNKSSIGQLFELIKILRRNTYKRLVLCGWDRLPLLFLPFFVNKKKNCVVCESSIYEFQSSWYKNFAKVLFLRRIDTALVAGRSQKQLVDRLHFRGRCIITGGCGLLEYQSQPGYTKRDSVKRFLYVGRLVKEKNLGVLVEAFSHLQELELSIVGFGPLYEELQSNSSSNISFVGPIKNKELSEFYQRADVFILPSASETWGLVVEEALNNGTPVIISDRVGCRDDMLAEGTGLVFHYSSVASLLNAIHRILDVEFYNQLRNNVSRLDFLKRAQSQVQSYIQL